MPRREVIGFARAEAGASLKPFLKQHGIEDPDQFIRDSDLDPDKMGDFNTLYRLRNWVGMLEKAAATTGDECLGLEYGIQVPVKDLGVLGYMMFNSPNLGGGLKAATRFYAVQQTLARVTLTTTADEAHLVYSLYDPILGPTGQLKDAILAFVVRFCREATGDADWAPNQVRFEHAAPSSTKRHDEYFGVSVEFSAHETAIEFPVEDLEKKLKAADEGLLPVLQRHAAHLLEEMPVAGDTPAQVRRTLTQALATGDFEIEEVSKHLGTNPRTLQRRLSEAGTTFQEILDSTRLALSKRYLKDRTLTLTEIALLLGYSEMSAYSRAFRRWTGSSPISYRREHG